jgi:hypothetical protein
MKELILQMTISGLAQQVRTQSDRTAGLIGA